MNFTFFSHVMRQCSSDLFSTKIIQLPGHTETGASRSFQSLILCTVVEDKSKRIYLLIKQIKPRHEDVNRRVFNFKWVFERSFLKIFMHTFKAGDVKNMKLGNTIHESHIKLFANKYFRLLRPAYNESELIHSRLFKLFKNHKDLQAC